MKKKDIYKYIDELNYNLKDCYPEFYRLISFLHNDEDIIELTKYIFLNDKFYWNKGIIKVLTYQELDFLKYLAKIIKDNNLKIELIESIIEDRKRIINSEFYKLFGTSRRNTLLLLKKYEEFLLSLYKIKRPNEYIKTLYKEGKLKAFKENCFIAFYDKYPRVVLKNLELFLESYNLDDKAKNYLQEMQKIDSNSIRNLDYFLLQDKYISILTPYQMCLITHDTYLMYFLHNITDNEYKFIKYILSTLKYNNDLEEYFYYIKHNIASYSKLINSIDFDSLNEEELFILKKLITYENIWDIKKLSDLNNIEKLYNKAFSKACQNYKDRGTDLNIIQELIILKKYGIDRVYEDKAKSFQENPEPLEYKNYSNRIERMHNVERLIREYKSIDTIHPLIDKISYTRYYRFEYEKLYNEQLFNVSKAKKIVVDSSTYYDSGDKFYILMTSKSPIIKTEKEYNSLKQDWNRKDVESSFFCACLISNYMLNFCETDLNVYYGFNKIQPDSLLSMGPDDLGSFTDIDCFSCDPLFYTPFNLCFNTIYSFSPSYNEVDIKRYSKNTKIQPDYIICFKLKGTIKNKYEAELASKQFGNIPIVLVDIDRCIDNSLNELNNYIEQYKINKTDELKDTIFKHTVLFFRLCQNYNVIPCIDESEIYRIFKNDKQYEIRHYI